MPDNLYENPKRPPKASSRWRIARRPVRPPPTPQAPPTPDLSSMSGTGTINKHARKLMERSKRYE